MDMEKINTLYLTYVKAIEMNELFKFNPLEFDERIEDLILFNNVFIDKAHTYSDLNDPETAREYYLKIRGVTNYLGELFLFNNAPEMALEFFFTIISVSSIIKQTSYTLVIIKKIETIISSLESSKDQQDYLEKLKLILNVFDY